MSQKGGRRKDAASCAIQVLDDTIVVALEGVQGDVDIRVTTPRRSTSQSR